MEPGVWQEPASNPMHQIQFYIDPMSGQVFTQKDVDTYFKRISVPPTASFFKPMNTIRIIQHLLEEFSRCFESDKDGYKQEELMKLAQLLETWDVRREKWKVKGEREWKVKREFSEV